MYSDAAWADVLASFWLMVPTSRLNMTRPNSMYRLDSTCSAGLMGTMSPWPVVVEMVMQ